MMRIAEKSGDILSKLSPHAYESRLHIANEIAREQRAKGTWEYDPYMLGICNGMEYALSILEGRDPKYLTDSVPNIDL